MLPDQNKVIYLQDRTIHIFVHHHLSNTTEQLLPELLGHLDMFFHPRWLSDVRGAREQIPTLWPDTFTSCSATVESDKKKRQPPNSLLCSWSWSLYPLRFLSVLEKQLPASATSSEEAQGNQVAHAVFPRYLSPLVQKHSKLHSTLQEQLYTVMNTSTGGTVLRQTS